MKPVAASGKVTGHWIGKTSAGAVCGFLLAIVLSGLLVRFAPGSSGEASKAEVAMLSVPLVWTGVFASAFASRTGLRAWTRLGAVSVLVLALFEACK
jgi:hypothetical protein